MATSPRLFKINKFTGTVVFHNGNCYGNCTGTVRELYGNCTGTYVFPDTLKNYDNGCDMQWWMIFQ